MCFCINLSFCVVTFYEFVNVSFCQQIRPIDKKLQYQIQKLTSARISGSAVGQLNLNEKESDEPQKTEDLLRYRPNPDMLVSKTDMADEVSLRMRRVPVKD